MGLCFGVRDALDLAFDAESPQEITIYGELVHNEEVNAHLKKRGFLMMPESDQRSMPETDRILITAHGLSQTERTRLEQAGKTLIDTTCPLVERVHHAAQSLARSGWHVLIIGQPGHVEVLGITGDLESFDVVADVEDVRIYPHEKLAVICQTTTMQAHAHQVLAAIRATNPHATVRFTDTICDPTKRRILAVEELARKVDVMVVVGGRKSNNTKQLVELSRSLGVPTHHVQGPEDLAAEWFRESSVVGLTAGTSTTGIVVEAVWDALQRMPHPEGAEKIS